jgi:hypothetical protein
MIKYIKAYNKHMYTSTSLCCNRPGCNGSDSCNVLAITVVFILFTVIITLQSCNMELYNDYYVLECQVWLHYTILISKNCTIILEDRDEVSGLANQEWKKKF